MDNNSEPVKFLCADCMYGYLFRIAKNVEATSYDTVYTCGPFEGSQGPGGWDGKTCPNFTEGKKKDPFNNASSS